MRLRNLSEGAKAKIIFLVGLLVIFFVSLINMFPQGYIFSGNDVVQFINLKDTFPRLFFTWNGLAGTGQYLLYFPYSLFYLPFTLLSQLAVSASAQSFFYYFIFLGASYVIFFFSTKPFIKIPSNHAFTFRILLSLVYALNPYTFYAFTYTWAYSPFLFLYPLLPAIFALTYLHFTNSKVSSRNIALLGVVFFISNIAFGNFSFFVALLIFLGSFVLMLFALRLIKGKILLKSAVYLLTLFAATFWVTITNFVSMGSFVSNILGSGSAFDLGSWILSQRIALLPQVFLYPNLDYLLGTLPLFFFIGAFGLVTLLVISIRKFSKLSLIFFALSIISIFITSKGLGLFSDEITLKIFTLPVINTLRSYDKTLIFLPYFMFMIIFIGVQRFYLKNDFADFATRRFHLKKSYFRLKPKTVVLASLLLILIGVCPFFVGGIQTHYSYDIPSGKDYQSSDYSFLVQIPNDYYDAAEKLNQDPVQNKILDLPYSVINSIGWVNYPKWHLVGADPTDQLFNKPKIQANSEQFYQISRDWNAANINDSRYIVTLMSLYNVQYIIYHKDVAEEFVDQTSEKIDLLRNQSDITLVKSYDNFDLYSLNSTFFRPSIYPSSNVTYVNGTINEFISLLKYNLTSSEAIANNNIFFLSNQICPSLATINSFDNDTGKSEVSNPKLTFQQINPTQYQVKVENASEPFFLVFSQTYDPWWKAYVSTNGYSSGETIGVYNSSGVTETKIDGTSGFSLNDASYLFDAPMPENTHFQVNGYANAWYIDPSKMPKDQNGNFEITLFYAPQSFFVVGFVVSLLTVTVSLAFIAVDVVYRRFRVPKALISPPK